MIRLLDKRSVSVQAAIEKKRQIDQGVQLARKVDALRETKLEEEAKLALFRSETVARTQGAIDLKIKEKDALDTQIRARKHELSELRKPLDDELQAIEETKTALEWEKQLVYERKSQLDHGIALNIRRERENDEEGQRIEKERERSVVALTEAELKREIASDVLTKAKSKAVAISKAAEAREREIDLQEKQLVQREKAVEREVARLKVIEKQQKEKDKEIKDKYETLQRDINRMKYASI